MADTHSKLVGYALWLIGFTGSHRFYYGKPISGTIWMFTGGLLGVGWLIDLFLIPSMERQAEARFASGTYSYNVAWLLQAYTGLFGLHRLYLGNWMSGLLWMFTGGVFGMGWLYDFWTLNEQVREANLRR